MSFSFLSGYNRNMTSQRVCYFLDIATDSSLSPILFDFADIFIIRNIKSAKVLLFDFVIFPFLMYVFLKTCPNLARESDDNSN